MTLDSFRTVSIYLSNLRSSSRVTFASANIQLRRLMGTTSYIGIVKRLPSVCSRKRDYYVASLPQNLASGRLATIASQRVFWEVSPLEFNFDEFLSFEFIFESI